MYKSHFIIPLIIITTLFTHAEMKCAAGKCGSSMKSNKTKVPPKTETSVMKCETGKCGSAMGKNVPLKEITKKDKASAMKCQSGKCSGGKETSVKKVPSKKMSIPSNKKPTIEQLFNVRTVKVKEVNSVKKQINYGYIVAKDSSMVKVAAWFSGYVEVLHVDTLYQKVKQGQALSSVYSPEVYKAKQDYLNAIRFNAKRPSAGMVQSAKRKLILLGVSQTEILQVRDKGKVSRLTTIYAPSSGWIFEKNITQGAFLNEKKSLYTIIDLSKVWLEAKLFQNELAELSKLSDFKVTVKGIDNIFTAKKELLYPMIDPKEATATLRLSINNENEKLKPGMYAKLHSSTQSSMKLVIPRTAAMRKSGAWYVFLATEFKGEYEPLAVKLKPLDNKNYEVTKGLKAGDTLVNNALFMMDSDAQINSVY
jgi:Cu(I)/Ag(I) efflux system membrane fusion protein